MSAVTCVHASLKHSGDRFEVAGYIARLIRVYRADLVTTTESSRAYRRAIRRALPRKEWGITRRGEYLIIWRRRVFSGRFRRLIRRGHARKALVARIIRMTQIRGEADWRNLFTAEVQLTHRGDHAVHDVWVGHLASGIEAGDDYRTDRPAKVATHKTGVQRWSKTLARRRRRHPAWAIHAHGDTNANYRRPAWLDRMTDGLGLPSVWADHVPNRGTHDHRHPTRLIDAAHTTAEVQRSGVCVQVEPPEWVDHWAIWYVAEGRER